MGKSIENALIVAIAAGVFVGCIAGSTFTKSRLANGAPFEYLEAEYRCHPTHNGAGDEGEDA